MSKYRIIELGDKTEYVMEIGTDSKGRAMMFTVSADDLEELTADYINEHFSDLQDTAYQRGLEDGKKEAESSEFIENAKADAFNKGMLFKEEKIHDAFLRGVEKGKAVNDKGCEGCKYEEVRDERCRCCTNFYCNQWTAKDDKFELGDEIIDSNGVKGCVVSNDNEGYDTMYALFDGFRVPQYVTQSKYHKTGKRYDIDKILDEIKGEGNK